MFDFFSSNEEAVKATDNESVALTQIDDFGEKILDSINELDTKIELLQKVYTHEGISGEWLIFWTVLMMVMLISWGIGMYILVDYFKVRISNRSTIKWEKIGSSSPPGIGRSPRSYGVGTVGPNVARQSNERSEVENEKRNFLSDNQY